MNRFSIPILSIILALPAISAANAKPGLADALEIGVVSRGEPVYFSGDRFSYNLKSRVMEGAGRIEIVQNDTMVQGERITINLSTNIAEIEGHVAATRRAEIVTGDRGVYDFEKKEGVFYEARGQAQPWYVAADTIEREPGGQYTVENSSLTTCDLPSPHYRLASRTTTVIPDERVVARDIFLYAGTVPVFYLPYYSHRLDEEGPPIEWEVGSESDVGVYAYLGYNLELGEKVRLKPHVSGYTKSGVGGGLDGRLDLFDGTGRGRFETFYISDMNDDNTDVPGVERDRGKTDVYYRQELPYDITSLLQVEYISDQEFLKTFDFDDFSDRELPETFFNIERTTNQEVISLTVRERIVDYTDEVSRLPELRIELLERRILDTGFFFGATNDFVYLDSEVDDFQTTRNFTEGRFTYPARLWNWLGLVPFIEGDATYYSDTLVDDDEYRLSWSSGLAAQSRFHKVYGSPFQQYTAFRHLIVPTITYQYRPSPNVEPEELPGFDAKDEIDRQNDLEIELRNYLQAKDKENGVENIIEYNFSAGLELDDGEDKLATLENEFLFRPVRNWELALKAFNDFRDEARTDLISGVARYTKPDSFGASAGVIHEDTTLKPYDTQVVYSLAKAFGPLWRVGFEQRYNIREDEFTYHEVWVWRDLHCWEALLKVRDRRESTSVMLSVNIKAFPMGNIERAIALKPSEEKNPWPTRW